MSSPAIRVYGETWCGDCQRVKALLTRHQVPFEWHDTSRDLEARDFVSRTLPGEERIPVVVLRDGSCLVEPSDEELSAKLALHG
jgi:glutaredoxin